MTITRQRILEYLQTRDAASPSEISRALHMTRANARHHLTVLLQEGVVRSVGTRKEGSRGRPAALYGLSANLSQHSLDILSHALLETILDSVPSEQVGPVVERLAARLVPVPAHSTRNPVLQLNEAITQLNKLNYRARWEAHSLAPKVVFQHCPYATLLPQHPELCHMDVKLLERLLATKVTLSEILAPAENGLRQCIFFAR